MWPGSLVATLTHNVRAFEAQQFRVVFNRCGGSEKKPQVPAIACMGIEHLVQCAVFQTMEFDKATVC